MRVIGVSFSVNERPFDCNDSQTGLTKKARLGGPSNYFVCSGTSPVGPELG